MVWLLMVTLLTAPVQNRCFIGDSFTEGLRMYGDLEGDFYDYRGISTSGILKKNAIRNLEGKEYDKVFILLGINEVCNNDPDLFIENYQKILRQTKELQPGAKIYVQSIVHTTGKMSRTTKFKNEWVDEYNKRLKKLCKEAGVEYVDLNELYDNGNGDLFSDWSKDGIHLKQNIYWKWVDKIEKM